MPTEFPYEVFLSHNAQDRLRGRRLVPSHQLFTINFQPAGGRRFIPLLLGDCALPDTLRHYKVVDFREESDAAFAEVPATLRDALLPKLLSGELTLNH